LLGATNKNIKQQKMNKLTQSLTLLLLLPLGLGAQTIKNWSLKECIDYARENNLTIKQQVLNAEYYQNLYEQNRLDRLPSLNGSAAYNMSFGRVPDETTYDFKNQTTQFGRFSLVSSVPVFQGFSQQNEIEQNRANWKASQKQAEKAGNDLALSITAYYLQILFDKELLEVAQNQLEVAHEQVKRTEKLVEAGSISAGTLLEIKSQSAQEALNVTQMQNNLSLSLLDLAQALDLEDPSEFDILTPDLPKLKERTLTPPNLLYQDALTIMPQIDAARYDLESSEYALKSAKGTLYPSLSLDAGWGTNVSKSKGDETFKFSDRFSENSNEYVGLTLSIPLFNGLAARHTVKNARIGILNAQYALEKEKQTLRKEIQQAYADALAAYRKYEAGMVAVTSYEESFRYTEQKFNVGMVNSVDYSVAKNEYLQAQSEFLQAKYEYLLRTKILSFYKGEPIVLE
jgi:outer membrane protein